MAKAQSTKGTKAVAVAVAAPVARPAPNLQLAALPWPTGLAQPRANSKRAAWVGAIVGAKTVGAALAAPMPAGVPAPTMAHVNWCVRHKLVATKPPATKGA